MASIIKRKKNYSIVYNYSGVLERTKLSKGQRGMARKLRHHGKTRHKKGEQETRGKIRISNPIELRPEEANNRSVIGHWEGDTAFADPDSELEIQKALSTLIQNRTVLVIAHRLILIFKQNTKQEVPSVI